MAKRIEFKSQDNAKSVFEHLYNVQLEGNCLVFREFDEEAFDLAVALEGLDESAYDVLHNIPTARTLREYGEAIRQSARFYDRPKYVVKIKLFDLPDYFPLLFDLDPGYFTLLADSTPCISSYSHNLKELSINLTVNALLRNFVTALKELTNNCTVSLEGFDKVIFIARNIQTESVQYFLAISCDGQLRTIQLYPVNNVTIERVLFENH